MNKANGFPQLFLRLALGVGFLLPVMDRLGILGAPGSPDVAWGNWENFTIYTNSLMPVLNKSMAGVMGLIATMAEIVFGICLILGFKTRLAAIGSALLTFTFAICMMLSSGIYAPFKYPVFVFTGGGLVLWGLNYYKWSIDAAITTAKRK